MDPRDAAERFLALFHEAYLRFHARQPARVRAVSPESLAVLLHLAAAGPLTIAECCGHFDRSQAAMSDIVTRLERRGLLSRMPDERDRRRTLVWMTPEGRAALERSTRVLDAELLAPALARLGDADCERLLGLFESLIGSRDTGDES